jgi:hypothetical protein
MLKCILVAVVLTLLVSPRVLAQAPQGPSPEQVQTMLDVGGQALQNMQDSGVDPLQVAGQAMQQMQQGTFDPAAFRQQLMDNGIITQQMLSQTQGAFGNRIQMAARRTDTITLAELQTRLGVSDSEWKLLEPKVLTILAAQAELGQVNWINYRAGTFDGASPVSEVNSALDELRYALDDVTTPPRTHMSKVKAWRDACARGLAELSGTQKDLLALLTGRQEAIMTVFGILR